MLADSWFQHWFLFLALALALRRSDPQTLAWVVPVVTRCYVVARSPNPCRLPLQIVQS